MLFKNKSATVNFGIGDDKFVAEINFAISTPTGDGAVEAPTAGTCQLSAVVAAEIPDTATSAVLYVKVNGIDQMVTWPIGFVAGSVSTALLWSFPVVLGSNKVQIGIRGASRPFAVTNRTVTLSIT